jgi:hypothetical protein
MPTEIYAKFFIFIPCSGIIDGINGLNPFSGAASAEQQKKLGIPLLKRGGFH